MKPYGLYIHIPFCENKCPYCDFFSVKGDVFEKRKYIDALKKYINHYSNKNLSISSVYFGGGTPTVLESTDLCEILNCIKNSFNLLYDAEISFEANPNTVDFKYLKNLVSGGFNRISFGVQSLDEQQLKSLGRKHSAKEAVSKIKLAKEAGFNNISADLMLGVPGQTTKSLKQTLEKLTTYEINHVSAYMLKIEEGTPFFQQKDSLQIADEEILSQMYLITVDFLNNKGFKQYEISNFAKEGYECRHNLIYWQCEEYLAFGPSAYFYYKNKRGHFSKSLEEFIFNAQHDKFEPIFDENGGDLFEYFILNLRLSKGVNLKYLKQKYNVDTKNLIKKAESLEKNNLLKINNDNINLTKEGFLLSNEIIAVLSNQL
ncbi:MAG: radical SAM family heme chaperone HemW [Oscillospiraceae bacterium]